MRIRKGKLSIELIENTDLLLEQFYELKRLVTEITKSPEYRALYGKTQVSEQPMLNNGVRSRGQHSMNVAIISKEIIEGIYDELRKSALEYIKLKKTSILSANPEEKERRLENLKRDEQTISAYYDLNKRIASLYAMIMGLSHDLGHTPFGHIGENVINDFMLGIDDKEERKKILQRRKMYFGTAYEEKQGHSDDYTGSLSFEHNEQSAILFQKIAERCGVDKKLVDVKKIILGILAHSRNRYKEIPDDLIAQVIRQADKICYINYDFEELRNAIDFRKVNVKPEVKEYLRKSVGRRIKYAEDMIVDEAIEKGSISDNGPAMSFLKYLEKVYKEPIIYQLDEFGRSRLLKGENCEREEIIIQKLLQYYYRNPGQIPTRNYGDLDRNENFTDRSYPHDSISRTVTFRKSEWDEDSIAQEVVSFVISLTNKDTYNLYHELVNSRIQKGKGYGIEPITQEEIQARLKMKREDEYTNMMMMVMLEELKEGNIMRSIEELDKIVQQRLKEIKKQNNMILSPEAEKAKKRMIEVDIPKQAAIDQELYQAMVEADSKRENDSPTNPDELEK